MSYFNLKDNHIAFCNAVVNGMKPREAYLKFVAKDPKQMTYASASVCGSQLLKRPEIKNTIEKFQLKLIEQVTGETSRIIAKEFTTTMLTVDEMDCFHSAIIQGLVEVEEVVPVYRWNEVLNSKGAIVQRTKEANFVRVKRPPNIKEKQISIDALYKRFGNYAARKFIGAIGELNGNGDVTIKRMILLSTGEKIPMLSN